MAEQFAGDKHSPEVAIDMHRQILEDQRAGLMTEDEAAAALGALAAASPSAIEVHQRHIRHDTGTGVNQR